MIEVFKTDVKYRNQADVLIGRIEQAFKDHYANFDLEDCDKILRIENRRGLVKSSDVIYLLKNFGYTAEVLQDVVPAEKDKTLMPTEINL